VELQARADQGDVEALVILADAAHASGEMRAAAYWYRRAAEQGHIRAQVNLGFLTAGGLGVDRDEAEAIQWYLSAAEQGSRDALNNLGMLYHASGRFTEAVDFFRRAGDLGHADALAAYAFALDAGMGILADSAAALACYERAADLGASGAQYNLGVKYSFGRGVVKDLQQAAVLYRAAATQGNLQAETALGYVYAAGEGVPKDDCEAVSWYRRAALKGSVLAQERLGLHHASVRGIPSDNLAAFHWFALAAIQGDEAAQENLRYVPRSPESGVYDEIEQALSGDAEAQRMIGYRLYEGDGITLDREAATLWIRLAAENGDATAQTSYAMLLQERGDAVSASVVWLRRAAEQRNARALHHLGLRELQGQGVPVDLKAGMQHLVEASLAGSDEARSMVSHLIANDQELPWDEILDAVRWPRLTFIMGPFSEGNSPAIRELQLAGDFSEASGWALHERKMADIFFPEFSKDGSLLRACFDADISIRRKQIEMETVEGEHVATVTIALSDIQLENGLPVYWPPDTAALDAVSSMIAMMTGRMWVRQYYEPRD